MADVFISYAREDRDRAQKLAKALLDQKLSVWWDRDIIAGKAFDEVIERELDSAKSVVVLWSRQSIASEWVKNEAAVAAERDILVPALIERVRPPIEFRRKHTVDLVDWRGNPADHEFLAVCRAVLANVGRTPDALHVISEKGNGVARLISNRRGAIAGVLSAMVVVAIVVSAVLTFVPPPLSHKPVPTRVADVFVHAAGSFERQGEIWVEYPPYSPGTNFRFREARRDSEFIYLYDETRHKEGDPARIMYLRLPITGGMAQWSYPNPFIWQDLYPVTPKWQ